MPATINFFDTHYMAGMIQGIHPNPTFFRDRYFPTEAGDIFKADKVLVEYRDGDRMMAPFVVQRAGDITIARTGYEIHEYRPAYIGISRELTIDDLEKRGFGEALYSQSTQADRARTLLMGDFDFLDLRITRREEWLAVQTMLNNGCTMQQYIDAETEGEPLEVCFYDKEKGNTALYTTSKKWDAADATFQDVKADVRAMCRMLSKRGLPAADLLMGVDVADHFQSMDDVQRLLDRNSGIQIGRVEEQLSPYDGVTYLGTINFGGRKLNVISVDETYDDQNGEKSFFPKDGVMVTAPGAGHMMYGQITQMERDGNFVTLAEKRVPKLIIKDDIDMRKLRVACRPLAAPKNRDPWIFASKVIG